MTGHPDPWHDLAAEADRLDVLADRLDEVTDPEQRRALALAAVAPPPKAGADDE